MVASGELQLGRVALQHAGAELALRYALLVMAAIAFGMLAYFWAKGWIGGRWRRRGGAGGEHGD
jgi:hypothetical protein